MSVEAIRFGPGSGKTASLWLLDQRVLPHKETWIECTDAATSAKAITDMVVRGAPAIGITAAFGMALEARNGGDLRAARATLLASRPTAVNLRWALDELAKFPQETFLAAAKQLHADDIAINKRMGAHGAALLPKGARLYHHCNTGALATGGWGTALGIIRSAWAGDKSIHVWVGETRPYLQGARLTAWELQQEQIPCTLVADSTAASLMARGAVDAILVGCDRVAANGDAANKIGTLMLAVLAKRYNVPFYVAMPTSTLDRECPTGHDIPIEERDASEVRGHRGIEWAADVPVHNPAFDVTPAELITAWVTEKGVWHTPFPAEQVH